MNKRKVQVHRWDRKDEEISTFLKQKSNIYEVCIFYKLNKKDCPNQSTIFTEDDSYEAIYNILLGIPSELFIFQRETNSFIINNRIYSLVSSMISFNNVLHYFQDIGTLVYRLKVVMKLIIGIIIRITKFSIFFKSLLRFSSIEITTQIL